MPVGGYREDLLQPVRKDWRSLSSGVLSHDALLAFVTFTWATACLLPCGTQGCGDTASRMFLAVSKKSFSLTQDCCIFCQDPPVTLLACKEGITPQSPRSP